MSYCALQKQSAAEQLPSLDSSWSETSEGRRQEPCSSWTPFNNIVVPISTPCCSSAACQSQYVGCQPELRAGRDSSLQGVVSSSSQRPFILPSLPIARLGHRFLGKAYAPALFSLPFCLFNQNISFIHLL